MLYSGRIRISYKRVYECCVCQIKMLGLQNLIPLTLQCPFLASVPSSHAGVYVAIVSGDEFYKSIPERYI